MGFIVNPRGPGGSGKSELARRILAQYGWRSAGYAGSGSLELIQRQGRGRPLGYRLRHPLGGRSLVVVGHYEVASGGCDTVRAADGGIEEIVRRAAACASAGHDVLIEGLRLSSEYERSAALARRHSLHILRLATSPDQCARNLVWRRRRGRAAWRTLARIAADEHERVAEACERLSTYAVVETLGFDDAFARAQVLLGIGPRDAA